MYADELLVETIEGLLEKQCTPERIQRAEGSMDSSLWTLLEESGLTTVGRSEADGGAGGTLHDLVAIVKAAGRHAAPVPLADTLIAATFLPDRDVPVGPLALAVVRPDRPFTRTPWAGVAGHVVAVSANGIALHSAFDLAPVRSGVNYAGEPWHEYSSAALLTGIRTGTHGPHGPERGLGSGAFGRSMLLAGALDRAVDLTIQYVNERQQFGKNIGSFQAIQHYVAEMAGEAAAANAAVDNAADVVAMSSDPNEHLVVIGAAKAYCGRAVTTVARLAHQIHGAIGYTDEHRLQYTTKRLWSWRDEFGSETEWAAVVGRSFAATPNELWSRVTSWPPTS